MARNADNKTASLFGYDSFDADVVDGTSDPWVPPSSLPDYSGSQTLALDIETFDPDLKVRGAGNVFGAGYVDGVSVAVSRDTFGYFPLKTPWHDGFSEVEIVDWLQHIFTRDTTLVGHSLLYDCGWLSSIGFDNKGKFFDVQFAEALLNEHKNTYTLDSIAQDCGLGGKLSEDLYEWCSRAFGGSAGPKQRSNLYRAPLRLVGPYAEADAYLPVTIREQQVPRLEDEGLMRVCDMENALIPMLLAMRSRGVRVDLKARSVLAERLSSELIAAKAVIRDIAGFDLNADAPTQIAGVFDANGWEYPLTEKTKQPSFTKVFLSSLKDIPFAKAVQDVRKLSKMQTTFVQGYFDKAHNSRLHCNIHPLRTGENGTVSGRMSTTAPNLGNIPSRDPVYGPLLRGLFKPEEGEDWICVDYQQAELRFLAHYAIGSGADELRKAYQNDPGTDFHAQVQRGTGLSRAVIKTLVFSLCYGSGVNGTADLLGVSVDEARDFREAFFGSSPFIKTTFNRVMTVADRRGYLKTIMGRRARFPFWEPSDFDLAQEIGHFDTRSEAMQAVIDATGADTLRGGAVKRARCHKALNAILQGGVADMLKNAMLNLWNSGVLDVTGAPLLTVYDEIDWSVPRTQQGEEAVKEIAHIMSKASVLKVPVSVDVEIGSDWGHLGTKRLAA